MTEHQPLIEKCSVNENHKKHDRLRLLAGLAQNCAPGPPMSSLLSFNWPQGELWTMPIQYEQCHWTMPMNINDIEQCQCQSTINMNKSKWTTPTNNQNEQCQWMPTNNVNEQCWLTIPMNNANQTLPMKNANARVTCHMFSTHMLLFVSQWLQSMSEKHAVV